MKKLFLSMLAAVTLFASCSQEEIISQTGNESLVSFSVITPELGSRVAGDGAAATDLYFVVYDETEGVLVETISSMKPYDKFKDKKADISLPLLNGHKYSLIFWAENPACPYAPDWHKKSISLDATTLNSNSETYDAFYAYVEPFTVTGPKQSTIQLKRPFAQLNIGTTAEDLKGVAKYYGVDAFSKSSIVVKTATAMDLTTGNVSGEKELTYAAAEFITSEKLKTDYEYLSMNYLLVSADKELVDVDFSIIADNKSISKTFENIPVQRNYKTNIYGNLFTSATDWTVDVAPDFDKTEYNPAEQLAALFEQGGEMTLYTDVTLAKPLVLTEGKTVTLNLNGNTIKSDKFETVEDGKTYEDSYPFYVTGGTLNIKGEGTIEAASAGYSMAVYATAGKVNIYGGEFYNNGNGSDLIYAKGTAEINIYGGYFKACEKQAGTAGTAEKYSALNLHDGSKTTASITVYGGSFYQFNPADNMSENPKKDFVADGYSSTLVGKDYVVVEGTAAATTKAFEDALKTAGVVTLVADVTTSKTANLLAGSTLDGGNNTLFMKDIVADGALALGLKVAGGTIQNITIDGNNQRSVNTNKGYRAVYIEKPTKNVVIDNVHIKGVLYAINTGNAGNEGLTLSVSNSTLEGWSSWSVFKSAEFKNCKFPVGSYYSEESIYNQGLAPYVDTVFENCKFSKGHYFDLTKFTGTKLTFKNCTVGGAKITMEMFAKLESGKNGLASELANDKYFWFEEGTNMTIDEITIE